MHRPGSHASNRSHPEGACVGWGGVCRWEEREHLQLQPRRRLKMGVSKRREEIRSSVRMAFLTLTHVSCPRHRSFSFELYVYASCFILNLICNRILMYVRFTWRATRTHVLHYLPCRRILFMLSPSYPELVIICHIVA